MTTILDARGNPIKPDKPALGEDIALAHTTSVRNPRPNSVASTITPQRLGGLLRSVVDGNNPQDYMTLAEEIEERDLHYASVLRTRKLAVAALPPSVEAASEDAFDKKLADEVRMLMESDQIPELFFDLLDGLGKGMGVCQILWDTTVTPWVPKDYKWVDPRYLRPDAETLSEILLISDDAPQGKPLEPDEIIIYDKEGNDIMLQQIQRNYDQIKADAQAIINDEMERIKNDPELCERLGIESVEEEKRKAE